MNFWITIAVIDIILLIIIGYIIFRKAKRRKLAAFGYVSSAIAITIVIEMLIFIAAMNFKHVIDNFFMGLGYGINDGRRITAILVIVIAGIIGLMVSNLIMPTSRGKYKV